MPIYTYICKECNEEFDLLVGVTSDKTELKCKKCGSDRIERTLGKFSVGKESGAKDYSQSACPTGTCNLG